MFVDDMPVPYNDVSYMAPANLIPELRERINNLQTSISTDNLLFQNFPIFSTNQIVHSFYQIISIKDLYMCTSLMTPQVLQTVFDIIHQIKDKDDQPHMSHVLDQVVESDSDTCSSKTERETETETDKLTTEESELEDVFN